MIYEFKVNELAEEFGVHRNTIRNWINSGTLPAEEGPGRRYMLPWEDYLALCEKFGRTPRIDPNPTFALETTEIKKPESPHEPFHLDTNHERLYAKSSQADNCTTCGACASACPIAGVDGLDPRKIVRMAFLGMNNELMLSAWPWKCSMCGKCEESCPVGIEIVSLIRGIRGNRDRSTVPGSLHKGVATCLEHGNNLGIPKSDFLFLLEDLGREFAEEQSFPGFSAPVDVRGARLLVTVNSKEPFAEPGNMKWWWKIFSAANESWTIASENWEGVNWALFSGDDDAMKTIVGRIVENIERLGCQALLLPECGHAYYATRLGLQKWYPETLEKIKIYSVFDLLLEYINTNRITLNHAISKKLTTYHDPCNYGNKSLRAFGHGYFEEGRSITRACCSSFVDMSPAGKNSHCCGAGGGTWAMPFSAERIYHGRLKARQVRETKAEVVVTSCHSCRDQLKMSLNREFDLNIDVKYLWELVADSLVVSGQGEKRA